MPARPVSSLWERRCLSALAVIHKCDLIMRRGGSFMPLRTSATFGPCRFVPPHQNLGHKCPILVRNHRIIAPIYYSLRQGHITFTGTPLRQNFPSFSLAASLTSLTCFGSVLPACERSAHSSSPRSRRFGNRPLLLTDRALPLAHTNAFPVGPPSALHTVPSLAFIVFFSC